MSKKIWIINMILIYLFCYVVTTMATDFHGVCVGIEDYPGTGSDLDDCVNDAEDMKNYLVWYQNWNSNNIKLSTDSDATESNIKSYINDMPNNTGNSELFLYSGHGALTGLDTYSGILTPSELQNTFGSNFNQYCTFLDACHSGVFVNKMTKGEISSACKKSESSYSGGPDDNGIYSYYILEGIKNNQADPTAGHVVSAKEVHDYAAPQIISYASSKGYSMHPQFIGNLGVLNLKTLGPTTSGTLIDDELWDQNVTLTGNVIVPSGKALVIYDKTVNLNNFYIRCSGSGKIIKQGTVSGMKHYAKSGSYYKGIFPSSNTIQQIIDWSRSGWDIYVGTGTYTENINMKANVDVVGSGVNSTTINGTINFNNDYNASLTDVTVKNKITVNNSDGAVISSFKAGHSNCYIDVASTSWLDVSDMTSLVSQTRGIYAHSSSDFSVITGSIKNKMDGVHLQDNSYGEMWWINFCYNSYYDIIAFSSSADAYGCTFSSSEEGGSVSGDVDWDMWNWCGGGGFGKKTANQTSTVVNDINTTAVSAYEPALNDFKEIMHSYSTMKEMIREDRKSEKDFSLHNYRSELESVIEKFKQFVVKYPKSPYTPSVLGRLAAVWRILGNFETLSMYMKGIANNPALQHLRPFALNALISMHIKQEEYGKAIELSDQLIEEYTDHPLIVEWLYGKGILYKYHLDKPTLAQEMFKMVITEYPNHPTAQSARDELEDSEHKVIGKDIAEKDITESNHALKLAVQSMPNPFNPETAIHFTLPEQGKVVLTIYDILGRKVKTLVEGYRTAGYHLVRWDGCDESGRAVASGTYIYRLRFKEKVLSRKLVLIW